MQELPKKLEPWRGLVKVDPTLAPSIEAALVLPCDRQTARHRREQQLVIAQIQAYDRALSAGVMIPPAGAKPPPALGLDVPALYAVQGLLNLALKATDKRGMMDAAAWMERLATAADDVRDHLRRLED